MKLVEAVYHVSRAMPDSERFGLTSQMQRSAVSIPSDMLKDMGEADAIIADSF